MTRSNALTIEPLSPAIGALLKGVNMAERASDIIRGRPVLNPVQP